jgi:hypothetical protein
MLNKIISALDLSIKYFEVLTTHAFLSLFEIAFFAQNSGNGSRLQHQLFNIFKGVNNAAVELNRHPSSLRRERGRNREIGILFLFTIKEIGSLFQSKKSSTEEILAGLDPFSHFTAAAVYHLGIITKTEKFDTPIWKHPMIRHELWNLSLSFNWFLLQSKINEPGEVKEQIGKLRSYLKCLSGVRPRGEFIIQGTEGLRVSLNLLANEIVLCRSADNFDSVLSDTREEAEMFFSGKLEEVTSGTDSIARIIRADVDGEFSPSQTVIERFTDMMIEEGVEHEGKMADGVWEKLLEDAEPVDLRGEESEELNKLGMATWRNDWDYLLGKVQERLVQSTVFGPSFASGSGSIGDRLLQAIVGRHLIVPKRVDESSARCSSTIHFSHLIIIPLMH